MSTLVDANVLLDVIEGDDRWLEWSHAWLERRLSADNLVINSVIYSEISASFADMAQLDHSVPERFFQRESVPFEAAFEAGRAQRTYRMRGGSRERTLPDFLIGAHANVRNYTLLTRDPRRYRTYFPHLDIIAPDTHP